MTFEQIFSQMADKAMAKRRAEPVIIPAEMGKRSHRFEEITIAMEGRWMTPEAVALRTNLRVEQVCNAFYRSANRSKVEKRGSTKKGFEWRLKSREAGQ